MVGRLHGAFGVILSLTGIFGSSVFFVAASILLLIKRSVKNELGLCLSLGIGVIAGVGSTFWILEILDALGSV